MLLTKQAPPCISRIYRIILVFLVFFMAYYSDAQNLRVDNKKIVDFEGKEVILRGMGLGGWMLQEPYMMETGDFTNSQHEIRAKINALIGAENTKAFYEAWHKNHCTKGDVDSMASWGFNSVRLPMHYNLFTLPIEEEPVAGENTWLEEGFTLTDSLLKWCSENQLYLILDLHAAPGGQGRDQAICDYDPSKPSLWESEANRQKTIALWRKLAERYSGEPWIGGYDLINETNWNFNGANPNGCSETTNIPLKNLLIAITNAIREVDTTHIIFLEGNCWANNYNGILPPWDDNLVVSFHKYWSVNDQGSIQGMLNIRNNYNIPLWLGESGENSNQWFTDAIRLMEKNSIGWCWWPLKKIGSVVNPLTIPKNAGYQTLLNYWKNGGTVPSVEYATSALMELAENSRIENCIFRKDVVDAMFRQINDKTSVPFSVNPVPGIVHATEFDMGENGIAYSDTDVANYHVTTGTYTAWNSGWAYRNDGVDLETSADSDPGSNKFNIGWTEDGEWVTYTLQVDSTAAYKAEIRYSASTTGSTIRLKLDDRDISGIINLPSSGSYANWKYAIAEDIILMKGSSKLTVFIQKGGANLGFYRFTLSKKVEDVPLKLMVAETHLETQWIHLTFNKPVDPETISSQGFDFRLDNSLAEIASFEINPLDPYQLIVLLSQTILDNHRITLSYDAGQITSVDQQSLQPFSNTLVINNLPLHYSIPGKIEAEWFYLNQGLQLEATSDAGGGQNVGYTHAGDYLEYRIRVGKTANYTLDVRAACNSAAGILEFIQFDSAGAQLNSATLTIPVTGGWQSWKTQTGQIRLNAGNGKLRVKIIKPEFNINWYRFTEILQDTTTDENKSIRIFPNPVKEKRELKIEVPDSIGSKKSLSILSMNGLPLQQVILDPVLESYSILVDILPSGCYILELRRDDITWRSKLLIL